MFVLIYINIRKRKAKPMRIIFAFLIFLSCGALAQQDDPVMSVPDTQISIDSIMRISEIRFKDGSKRTYEYRKGGLYIMRLYDRKGRLNSTVADTMDEDEIKAAEIKPIGHIERLR